LQQRNRSAKSGGGSSSSRSSSRHSESDERRSKAETSKSATSKGGIGKGRERESGGGSSSRGESEKRKEHESDERSDGKSSGGGSSSRGDRVRSTSSKKGEDMAKSSGGGSTDSSGTSSRKRAEDESQDQLLASPRRSARASTITSWAGNQYGNSSSSSNNTDSPPVVDCRASKRKVTFDEDVVDKGKRPLKKLKKNYHDISSGSDDFREPMAWDEKAQTEGGSCATGESLDDPLDSDDGNGGDDTAGCSGDNEVDDGESDASEAGDNEHSKRFPPVPARLLHDDEQYVFSYRAVKDPPHDRATAVIKERVVQAHNAVDPTASGLFGECFGAADANVYLAQCKENKTKEKVKKLVGSHESDYDKLKQKHKDLLYRRSREKAIRGWVFEQKSFIEKHTDVVGKKISGLVTAVNHMRGNWMELFAGMDLQLEAVDDVEKREQEFVNIVRETLLSGKAVTRAVTDAPLPSQPTVDSLTDANKKLEKENVSLVFALQAYM
jgi:hypothetical protein